VDQDPAIFVMDLQEAGKKLIVLKSFSACYCYFLSFEGTFTSFSKIKSPKEVTKQYESRFFLLFLLDDGRIQIRIHTSD
jgi:hypothetical protein